MTKKRIAVLHGGRSGEHEVSVRSAASIMEGLRAQSEYEVLPVFISREGIWELEGTRVTILPQPGIGGLYVLSGKKRGEVIPVDVVFPVLHGTYGEDGTVQGLLELARIPYVGAGVPGSAIGMDKILMKAGLKAAGLPVGPYLWFTVADWKQREDELLAKIVAELAFPCFVKPANLGSSVGISKAKDSDELKTAIEEALQYDRRVLVEKMLTGREIECSVLGNDNPKASLPGEIVPSNDFYDYSAKYIDDNSLLEIPAKLSAEIIEKVQQMAIDTFIALDCAGLGRVDFFVDEKTDKMWIIEINTLPGFTSISMYPKLWEATGISFNELLNQLIELALERFSQKEQLKTTFDLV